MKDALICLAAGKVQKIIIEKAVNLGIVVIAVDKNKHAPGFAYSTEAIYVSTYESTEIIEALELFAEKYNFIGVINRSSGIPVITSSVISEYFNIPGLPVTSAQTIVYKDKLREFCCKHQIPTPSFFIPKKQIPEDFKKIAFPVVVKPALSLHGKSGISIANSKKELESSIEYAMSNSMTGNTIIEEYLSGADLTLIGVVNNGEYCPICLLEEINSLKKNVVSAVGYKTHHVDNHNWMSQAVKISRKVVSILEISRSFFMSCFRSDENNKLRLIEIHLDLGGDLLIEKLLKNALHLEFVEFIIEFLFYGKRCPKSIKINPTLIIYRKGAGDLFDRGCDVYSAKSNNELNKLTEKKRL